MSFNNSVNIVNKKFVVYTVLIGSYDNILQPLVIDERFDYVLFSDITNRDSIGVWKLKSIPYSNDDLTRVSRYPKMHPHKLLGEYLASLYIDANVQIIGKEIYDRVVECYEKNIDWAGVQHPYRDCIYDEAYAIFGLDTEENIFRWCHRLRQEKYPRHRGLFENNIIFRLHNKKTLEIDSLWWTLYEQYTRRDQLTLFYVLYKVKEVEVALLLSREMLLSVLIHKHNAKKSSTRSIKVSFWEHARNRCRNGLVERKRKYEDFHYWLYGQNPNMARTILFIWGVCTLLLLGLIIKYKTYKRHNNDK